METSTPETKPQRRALRLRLGHWPCWLGWHWGALCWFCEKRVKFPPEWTREEIAAYRRLQYGSR